MPKLQQNQMNVFCKKWNSNEKIPTVWGMIKKHAESVPSPDKYTG